MTRAIGWGLVLWCACAASVGTHPAAAQDSQSKPNAAKPAPAAPASRAKHEVQPPAPAFRPLELAHDDPARAYERFDEHDRNAGREHEIAASHGHDFHVQDVRHLYDYEWKVWRTGRWRHDFFNGRFGWWYEVAGVWYPYAAPAYPYPTTINALTAEAAIAPADSDAASDDFDDGPVMAFAPLPPAPHVAYHCAKPAGFFPTVTSCDTDWVALSAH